jgi:uncharacterized protein YggE
MEDFMENKCIISVAGNGTVEVEADTLDVELTVKRTGENTTEVMKKVNIVINKILGELYNIGINKENITVSSMEINEYDRYDKNNNNNVYQIQQIKQRIKCIIYNLKENRNKVISIIDFVGNSDESITYSDDFFIKESKKVLKHCKDLAFQDALESAEQYAKLANVKIKKIIKISEFEPAERNINFGNFIAAGYDSPDESIKTNFSIKRIKTSITLYIDFLSE